MKEGNGTKRWRDILEASRKDPGEESKVTWAEVKAQGAGGGPPPLLPSLRIRGLGPEPARLEELSAVDAVGPDWRYPVERSHGKSCAKSLLSPQNLARRLLPADRYEQIMGFAQEGVPAECGDPWPEEVIEAARRAGPHISALTPGGVDLLWSDIQYRVDAGFVRLIPERDLFGRDMPKELKISRVAVVPQENRRDRIILNLSAEVKVPGMTRRQRGYVHPSVNETSQPAEDQRAVNLLGRALLSLIRFAFEVNCDWEIAWQKIDLSDGFWRMTVEASKEHNFVFQMPARNPGDEPTYVVPSSLQMG